MTDKCSNISDYIIAYVNNTINIEKNNILIEHLAICSECRKELAWVLSLSKIVIEESKQVPEDIMESAFSMIYKEENKQNTSLDELKSTLVTMKDVLSTTRKSIRLAMQFI